MLLRTQPPPPSISHPVALPNIPPMHPQDLQASLTNALGLPYNTPGSVPTTPQRGWASQGETFSLQTQSHVSRTKRRSSLNKRTKPYGKQKDPNHIPRPLNSFILFRLDFIGRRRTDGSRVSTGKDLSKQVSEAWRSLPTYEKARWEKAAHEAARQHANKYPTWKYRPRRAKPKERKNSRDVPPQLSQQQTGAPYEDSAPSLDLQLRRDSLRLSYWEDSVLSPNPRIAAYPNERLDQLPESLRRRSSSVPPPETSYANLGALPAFRNREGALPDHPSAFPNIPHRLSYSGIRNGFTPMDIFETFQERPHRKYADDIQPISSLHTGPPPSFENYTLQVSSSSSSGSYPRPMDYVSPFSQPPLHQGMSPAAGLSQWANNAGFSAPVLPPNIPTNASPHGEPVTSPIMDSLQAATLSLNSNHGLQYPAAGTHEIEEDIIIERMGSIDLGSSQSRTTALAHNGEQSEHNISTETKNFSPDIFSSELFYQYMNGQDPFQSSGLHDFSEKDVILGGTKDMEHQLYPFGLDIRYNLLGDDFLDELLEMPLSSGNSSVSGSGAGSPPSQRQLDFESVFVQ